MSRATTLAQRRFKTGDFSPSYALTIGGSPFSARLFDGSVSYSASDGTSDMRIAADASLSDYANARVRLDVGYGAERWEYFGGWLEEPEDDNWGGPANAIAYGPFKELAEATIGADVSYAGYTLGSAIVDLHARAGKTAGRYEIRGNPSFLLSGEEAALTLTTSFADGIKTFLDMAGWVSVDRPGLVRRYMPKPRPRPSSDSVASYSEADYAPGAFRTTQGKRNFYARVGAFKRADGVGFAWPPVIVKVGTLGRFKPPPLRTYWFEDFAGTENDAWLECGKLAATLQGGTYSWSLNGISANPEVHLHDHLRIQATELRDEGGRFKERYDVRYACSVDGEIEMDISREGQPMNLSGKTAIELSKKKLPKPFYVNRGASSVVRV